MRHKEKFLITSTGSHVNERAAYEAVINNPLNRIISNRIEKETQKTTDEGTLISLVEESYQIVEWETEDIQDIRFF